MGADRESEILDLLREKTRISVAELAERFGVSEVTARKDLARLEESGHAVRTHGGAILSRAISVDRPVDSRRNVRIDAKAAIAKAAAGLIRDGDTVFLDSGTTAAALARELRGRDLKVATHSLLVVQTLQDEEAISLYILGGLFNREARSFVGPSAIADLARYSFDLVLIGASGIDGGGTCSAQNILEADIKAKALAAGRRRAIIADSTKLSATSFAVFAGAEDYDVIVTDEEAPAERVASLRSAGIEVALAALEQDVEE